MVWAGIEVKVGQVWRYGRLRGDFTVTSVDSRGYVYASRPGDKYPPSPTPMELFVGSYHLVRDVDAQPSQIGSGPVTCKRCNEQNEYAQPNQSDGSFLCYCCRSKP